MKRAIVGGLAILLLITAPVWAATIDVGVHELVENTPNQLVPILVTGGEDIAGMNFFATIGAGGAANGGVDGPGFEEPVEWSPAMKLGTIWDDTDWQNSSSLTDLLVHPFGSQLAGGSSFIFFTQSPPPAGTITEVPAEGVLINLLVDTTGWFAAKAGSWELRVTDAMPIAPDNTELLDSTGGAITVVVHDGSISLVPVPEPTIVMMLLGLLAGAPFAWVWRKYMK